MDEARRLGLTVDDRRLARDLGVPVVPVAARRREGLDPLLQAVHEVASGRTVCTGYRTPNDPPALKQAVGVLVRQLRLTFPGLPNARWIALRLLEGDHRIIEAVRRRELEQPAIAGPVEEGGAGSFEQVGRLL
jgi:ferrous iron transport protein B